MTRVSDRVRELQSRAQANRHVPTTKSRQEAAEWMRDRAAECSAQQGRSTEDGARVAAEAMRYQDRKNADK